MKRRTLMTLGSVVGVVGLVGWQRNNIASTVLSGQENEGVVLADAPALDQSLCILTPEQVEGPYFFKAPLRSDVIEDRSGIPLDLTLQVVNHETCQPVAGAAVEIWHCDAAGIYSGYPEDISRAPLDTFMLIANAADEGGHVAPVNNKTFLRGAQISDQSGQVQFKTIVPGWYEPRIPHIHVKVFYQDKSYLTTQLYFSEDFTQRIYKSHKDYAPYGTSPYNAQNDGVLRGYPNADGLLLDVAGDDQGMSASCQLGIA